MDPNLTHTIDLIGGHVADGGERHNRVVFGKRLTGKDLFALDEDPQARNPTQYSDLIVRAHIVEFGTLPMPVSLTVMLGLDSIDREDLVDGCNAYQAMSAEGHAPKFLPDNQTELGWGFKVNGVLYNRVRFGKRTTGFDDVEADRMGLTGVRRQCFLVSKQIEKIRDAHETCELDGPIALEYFESLDSADIVTLKGAAELWRRTFRFTGAVLSRNGRGPDSVNTGDKDRVERGSDSKASAGAS